MKLEIPEGLCRCGCKQSTWNGHTWAKGHASRKTPAWDVDEATGCWIARVVKPIGYAYVIRDLKEIPVHRWMYEYFNGPIPDGLEIDHLCKTKRCVNPDHLEPVTHAVNMARYAATITHCPLGHAYTEENTLRKRKGRACRTCANTRWGRGPAIQEEAA